MENTNKTLGAVDAAFNYIDSGSFFRKPLRWLYAVIAALNILFPFFVLAQAIDSGVFRLPAKFIVAVILMWLVLLVGCCLLALLWWKRKNQLAGLQHDAFPVTPLFAHFVRTGGEWFGLFVGVVVFACGLIALLFLWGDAEVLGLPMIGGGYSILLLPVYGFLVIFGSRFVSEQVKVLVAIADNTAKK
jgi:hypothetical protein